MKNRVVNNRKIGAVFLAAVMILTAFTVVTTFTSSAPEKTVVQVKENETPFVGVIDDGVQPAPNPELNDTCGIDICLVIDSSGSIGTSNLNLVKDAFKSFVNALLPNTPTMMSVVDFDDTADILQTFTDNVTLLENAIDTPTNGGCTNWEDALIKAHDTFDPRPDKPDLIIFASDGNPNTVYGGTPCRTSESTAVDAAIIQANSIKSDGIRIITIGIGSSVDEDNLIAISSADAYYGSDFDTLEQDLINISSELCGGTISVRKFVNGVPAEGWEFTATVVGGTATPASGTTGADGFVQFSIELDDGVDTAYVNITETPQPDYTLAYAFAEDCEQNQVGTWTGYSIIDIPVTQECAIYCEFGNEEQVDNCPPTTEKTFCGPYYPAEDYPNPDYGPDMGAHYWVTTNTEITLHATDCPGEDASGVDYIHYEVWWDSDNDSAVDTQVPVNIIEQGDDYVTFTFMEECLHEIRWYAVDNAGNQESMHIQKHRVDDTGPNQSIILGDPKIEDFYHHSNGNNYTIVGPNTPIYITSDDTYDTNGTPKACAVGSKWLEYIVNWGNELDNWTHSRGPYKIYDGDPEDIDDRPGIITVVEYMPESCWHEIHVWCEDYLGNQGVERFKDFIVDADAPVQDWEYIGPELWIDTEHYISNSTIKRINVTDEGCIPGGSGTAQLHWKVQRIIGPDTVVTIAEDIVHDDEVYYFDNGLVVVTGDNDPDYGEISIDILVNDHCEHYIWHQATDYMGNSGTFYKQRVRIDKKPPVTTKTIGDPKYDGGYWVTTSTPIYLDAVDQQEPCAVGVKEIHYRYGYDQDDSGDVEENEFYDWVIVPGDHAEFYFTEECLHKLEWYAVDYLGNTEETHWQYHKVDDTPPNTTKTIGDPKYDNGYWVKTSTLFELDAVDMPPDCPSGVEEICYRIGWDENKDNVFDENEFTDWTCVDGNHTEFYLGEECYHKLEWYSIDNLGHQEETHWQYHRVDDTPPETVKTICGPTCGPDDYWVTTSTAITLTATDHEDPCAVGVWYIHYEIWWDSDNDGTIDTELVNTTVYDNTVTFWFTEECLHEIRWYAVDYLGNTETEHVQQHRVDNTPPETTKTVGDPKYDNGYWVTTSTPITLTATDYTDPCAVGDVTIHYEIWWDSNNDNIIDTKLVDEDVNNDWVTFYFTEECLHEIRWYAVDCLGNQEETHVQQHRVDDTPPTTVKTFDGPTYDNDFWLQDHGTTIILDATDNTDPCDVGVDYIHVELWKYNESTQQWENIWIEDIDGNHYEFVITEDCYHKIVWYAVDYLGNTETEHVQYHRVDSQPPITTKTVNDPWCGLGYYYVTTHTLIELDAVDQQEPCAVGVKEIHYRYGYDQDDNNEVEENEFYDWVIVPGDHAEFYFTEECLHKLEWYAVDYLENTEETHYQYHRVDDTPPTTVKTFDGPACGEDNYCVTTDTIVTLTATDKEEPCAVGGVMLYWEVWWDSDNDGVVDTPVDVNVLDEEDDYVQFKFLEECLHEIRYYAVDCLGNTETLHIQQHRVDDTPPEIIKTIGDPNISGECGNPDYWVSCETPITIDAQDLGCCGMLGSVSYKINDGEWIDITNDLPHTFTFNEDCVHTLYIKAEDCLGNTAYDNETFYVDCTPPQVTKEIGSPQCEPSFVTRNTRVWINASDDGIEPCIVGSLHLKVGIWYDNIWNYTWYNVTSGPVNVSFTFEEAGVGDDCVHYVTYWAEDDLGNNISEDNETFLVDNTPPVSAIHYKGVVPGWKQMNEEGFGDLTNDYAWAMAVYDGYLYVGTLNTNYSNPPDLSVDGCEVWRTDGTLTEDGKYVWEQVVGPSGTQMPAGFGMGIPGVRGMYVYDGLLWLGCLGTPSPVTLLPGNCTMWVTDGTNWTMGNIPGFGHEDISVRGMEVFNNEFYVGAQKSKNGDGANIYKYMGDPIGGDISKVDPTAWVQVFNTTANESEAIGKLKVFNGYLYAGGWKNSFATGSGGFTGGGCEIYRSADGVNWEEVVGNDSGAQMPRGFGNEDNAAVLSMEVFNGYLYVGTANFRDMAELWRTDGTSWEKVIDHGLGDLNMYMWRMLVFDGKLYVGTMNPLTGCELWMSETGDPGTWEKANIDGMDGETMYTSDLSFFTSGFIADQYGIRTMVEYKGHLIVGTASWGDWVDKMLDLPVPLSPNVGCEIWRINGSNLHVAREYINCSTVIHINASDVGIDPCISDNWVIHYRVWFDGEWTDWMQGDVNENISFTMGDFGYAQDCKHMVEYYAEDCLGNTEYHHLRTIYVDCTPPEFLVLKPKDGWYSDGSSIPAVVLAEDPWVNGCSSGIEEGSQGYGYLIDIFPGFNIIPLDSSNFLYDYESHEYIGNLVIPNPSGIPDGAVLFVAGGNDNVGNGADSIITLIHSYFLQWMAEQGAEDVEAFADWLNDIVTNFNVVVIGIDNTPPEVEILDVQVDVGSIYLEVNATDVLSGIESGTPCYVTIGGVTIGSLPYDTGIGGCQGTLPLAGAPDEEQTLSVCVADRAGSVGCDSEIIDLIPLPGPTTTGTDVQPDSSIIGTTLIVNATTFSSIATIADADYYIIDYYGNTVATGNLNPVDGMFDETSEDITTTIDTTGWEAGSYTIFVRGQDSFGRWGAYDEEEFSLVEEDQWRPVVCNILEPENGEEFNVECGQRYVHVVVDAYRPAYNGLPKDHEVDVTIWLDQPYGAPDLFYDVTFDGDYYTADIPVYWYTNGSELNLEAKAEDQYGNRGYDDTTFTVFTPVVYNKWMNKEWNLLTLPYGSIACDDSVESVLASIDGNFDMVFYYDEVADDWSSWVRNRPYNTLETLEEGKQYWVHIHLDAAMFFTDTTPPHVEITDPYDEYSNLCEGPSTLTYMACELETRTTMVYTQIYDHNCSYWNGGNWQSTPIWLECELDSEDDYTGWSYWFYETNGIWVKGHTYDILVYAVDTSGCISEVDQKTMHIYNTDILVEKTVNNGEELTIPTDTPFTFTIYVENNGDIALYDVNVTDYLSANFTYLGDAEISINGNPFTPYEPDQIIDNVFYWYTGLTMEPGEYFVITFNASITSCDKLEENQVVADGHSICESVTDTDNAYVMGICEEEPPGECDPDKTWTTDEDFEEGTLTGVYAEDDQLQLTLGETTTYPVMWIANAGEDSISKWDTSTNKELARYHTWFGPLGNHGAWSGPAPSRTCVDAYGNCYVANRDFDDYTPDVIKIFADDWIDRNGNGVIDTSYDANDDGKITPDEMLPMTDLNSNGIIDPDEIVDERIAWATQVGSDGLGRSLAIDLDGNIWVGLFDAMVYYKLDGETGAIIGGPYDVSPNTPYGALVDKYGYLWGSSLSSNLLKMNTSNPSDYTTYDVPFTYGIALGYDSLGNTLVYCGGNYPFVIFNSSSETYSYVDSFDYARPVAVDSQGYVFTGSNYDGSIAKYTFDGTKIWEVPGQVYSEVRGIVVDSDDNVWAIHRDTSKLCKYDGSNGDYLGVYDSGLHPYTYSDATGIGYSGSVSTGKWTVIHDSQASGTIWNSVSWNADVPEDTSITVKVRSSEDQASWSPWEETNSGDPLSSTPDGRYIEIEVTMQSTSGETPVLYDLTVDGTCAGGTESNPELEFYKEITAPEKGDYVEQDVGETVGFHIAIHNTGDLNLHDIVATDVLPEGLEYDEVAGSTFSATGLNTSNVTTTVDGQEITWDFNGYVLPPLTWIHIYFFANVTECGEHENIASVEAFYSCCDYLTAGDNATVYGICE